MAVPDLIRIIEALHELGGSATLQQITDKAGGKIKQQKDPYRRVVDLITQHMKDFSGKKLGQERYLMKPAYFIVEFPKKAHQNFTLAYDVLNENYIQLDNIKRDETEPKRLEVVSSSERQKKFLEEVLNEAVRPKAAGEGEEHLALKNYISSHPETIITKSVIKTDCEHLLLSADRIDILFHHVAGLTAIEVKPFTSNDADLVRGVFQCIKYKAILDAMSAVEGSSLLVEAILVVGRHLPDSIRSIADTLNVRVIDDVRIE